jgi:hypothetical protein
MNLLLQVSGEFPLGSPEHNGMMPNGGSKRVHPIFDDTQSGIIIITHPHFKDCNFVVAIACTTSSHI